MAECRHLPAFLWWQVFSVNGRMHLSGSQCAAVAAWDLAFCFGHGSSSLWEVVYPVRKRWLGGLSLGLHHWPFLAYSEAFWVRCLFYSSSRTYQKQATFLVKEKVEGSGEARGSGTSRIFALVGIEDPGGAVGRKAAGSQ